MASQTPIGSLLVEAGIISAKTLERVLEAQKKSDKRLGALLNELGIVTEEEIIEALGRQCRLRTIRRFADQAYARELLDLVPGELALQRLVFPLKQNDGILAVAVCDPLDHTTVEELANLTGMQIHLALATREELSAAVRKHYVGKPGKRPEKILLVDTSPVTVKSMQAALEDEGYEVLCAHDGIEGLKLAFARQPDLVICELAMPRLDGYTFLHALKAHPRMPDVPVILTSARESYEEGHRALKAGFADFIGKPVMPVRLLAHAAKACASLAAKRRSSEHHARSLSSPADSASAPHTASYRREWSPPTP